MYMIIYGYYNMKKYRSVHYILLLVFIVILASLLANCNREGLFSNILPKNVTLLVQNYWWAAEDGERRIKNKLPSVLNGTKFRYHYLIIDEKKDALKNAEDKIKRKRNDVVILGPVLSLKLGDKVFRSIGKFPFFIYLDGVFHNFSNTDSYNNFVYVIFNSKNTYRKAGEFCAELINNNGKVSRGGDLGSFSGNLSELINRETKVGIIYYSFNKKVKEELASFKEGFLSYGSDFQLLDAKINNLNNKQAIQHSLRGLQEKGAGLFLLLTLNLTPYCLDILEKTGGIAIVENADYPVIYKDVILFSINNEPVEGIKEALKAFLNSRRKSARVEVKSSIIWGNLLKEGIGVR